MSVSALPNLPRPELDRRAVVGGALALAGAAGAVRAAPAPGPPMGPPMAATITGGLKPLAPGVWAYVQLQGPGESNILLSNCGLVAGPKSLLAIDTTAAPLQAKAFRAAAEAATGKTFDRIVITHEHPDHVLGLPFFPAGAEIIAQEDCAAQMRKAVGSARPPFWSRRPLWADGDETYRIVLPTRTFKDRLRLHYGSIAVDLIYPGRAHTTGDTLVYLPREKIIFLGDIGFFGVTPLNGSGYVADWIKVCDRILAMDVATLVPGHGPVGGKAQLVEMRDYLALIDREARKRYDAGVTPGRAAAEIDLGPYAAWSDSDRIVANVVRLYDEFAGTIKVDQDRAKIAPARQEYMSLRAARG